MKVVVFEGSIHEISQLGIVGLLLGATPATVPTAPSAVHAPAPAPAPAPAMHVSSDSTPVLGRDFSLAGPNDWGGHHGAGNSFSSPADDPMAGGISQSAPIGGMPLPDTSRALASINPAGPNSEDLTSYPVSLAQEAAAWDKFCDVAQCWVYNWGKTIEVERIVEEPERGDDGKLVQVIDPLTKRGTGWAQQKKVTLKEMVSAPQPDREALMADMGCGAFPVPIMHLAKRAGGLQRLLAKALQSPYPRALPVKVIHWDKRTENLTLLSRFDPAHNLPTNMDWLDFIEAVAGQMVQLSRFGFPDLAKAHDPTSRWRRAP